MKLTPLHVARGRQALVAVIIVAGVLAGGCASKGRSKTQEAKDAWNDARASVLLNLASEQYSRGNLTEARKNTRDGLRTSNRIAGLYLLQARLDIEDNQLQSAANCIAAAKRLTPADPEAYYLCGIVAERWQQPEQAYNEYRLASHKAPNELAYLLAEAEILVTLDRAPEAATTLEARLVHFESSAPIRDMLAQVYQDLGRHAEAAELFRQAAMLAPDDTSLREHHALALKEAGDYEKAAEVLERLLTNPDLAQKASLHMALAECRLEQGNAEAARAAFMKAARLDPGNVLAWLGVGQAALAGGELDRAEYALGQAEGLSPTGRSRADVALMRGYLRLKQDRVQEAASSFLLASQIQKQDPTPVAMYGLCQQRLGRLDAARQYYQRALALDPEDALARHLMDALASNDREPLP